MKALRARYAVQADPLRTERRVELVLLSLSGALFLLALYLLLRIVMATSIEPIAPTSDSVRVAALAESEAPTAEARGRLLARPLFWVERRPTTAPTDAAVIAEAEAEAARKAAPLMKNVTLHGVYGSGEAGGVILSVEQRQLRLAVGEEIEGWRLERVTGDSAVFVNGDARDERELVPRMIEAPAAAAREQPEVSPPSAGEQDEPQLSLGGIR